jgi:hypothetical protein
MNINEDPITEVKGRVIISGVAKGIAAATELK